MDRLVEDYLTRAITERFEESLKEPDMCHEARDKVVRISLDAMRKTKGREGVGRRTMVRALELATIDLSDLHDEDRRRTAEYNLLVKENRALAAELARVRGEADMLRDLVNGLQSEREKVTPPKEHKIDTDHCREMWESGESVMNDQKKDPTPPESEE